VDKQVEHMLLIIQLLVVAEQVQQEVPVNQEMLEMEG
tara:strand:- start:273 stop:383 length:111 start_codon:yes stop_codon:yes gene_type:complete